MKRAVREPITLDVGQIEGNASNGLPSFYTEAATLQVPDIGEVRIGTPIAGAAFYVMLPGGRHDGPPTLFTFKMKDVWMAAVDAAVARYQTGEPAKWEEVE